MKHISLQSKLRHGFYACAFMLVLQGLLFLAYAVLGHTNRNMNISFLALQFLLTPATLFLLYKTLLYPALRLSDIFSSKFDPENVNFASLEGNSLFEQIQALMDREYDLQNSMRQAELDALQSQINPHFLYNTLECIRGQAILDHSSVISEMARELSEYFRYSINRSEKLVCLPDELNNVRAYIKIQNFRFSNRYQLRIHIEEADRAIVERCQLPRLTLQPIVENALLHGICDSEREVEFLDIFIELTEKTILLRVTDYGVGMSQEQLDHLNLSLQNMESASKVSRKGTGIALYNISERIHMIFGMDYGLRVYSTRNRGCTVEIVLPQKLASPDPAPLF